MTLFCDFFGLLLIALGIACLIGLALGRLLLPLLLPIRPVVEAEGSGDGLEQTVKGLLWLRKAGFWQGTVSIEDHGLDREGLLLARTLARQDGVEFDNMG